MGHKRAKNNKGSNAPQGKTAQNARQLAVEAIELCSGSLIPLPVILNNIFEENDRYFRHDEDRAKSDLRNSRDKAFCTQLVYGYFRYAGLLGLALQDFVKKPQDLPENCLITLYLGAYELLFLQNNESKKQATHATLFVYVEMVKKWHGQKLAGLINGVLRNVQREKDELLVRIENAQRTYSSPISSNQIPAKKNIRQMYDFADLPTIFSDEINMMFLQAVVKDSFFAPIATYRINEKLRTKLQENIQGHVKDHSAYLEASLAESLAPKVDTFEWYLKKPLAIVSPANYAYFDDTCLYIPHLETANIANTAKTASTGKTTSTGKTASNASTADNADIAETAGSGKAAAQKRDSSGQYLKQWEQEGILTRQGIASQLLVKKVAAFIKANSAAGDTPTLWDACCGRGGKSSALMEMGLPVSLCSDPNEERLSYATQNLKRLQLWEEDEKNNPVFRINSAQEIAKELQDKNEQFSFILLDSPCSTSGTIARNPEVKNRITQQTLESTIKLQAELLETTWQCLKEKGYLIYVTCSLFSRENERQVNAFLESHKALLVEQDYIVPHKIDTAFTGHDSLFYAILQKLA